MRETVLQPSLFREDQKRLDASLWAGSLNASESSIHQLSPYVGKLKSGMVRVLLELYTQKGETVLDPFSGSGVVPFEAVLLGRNAIGNDLSVYAYTLTRGKLEAPKDLHAALIEAEGVVQLVERERNAVNLNLYPEWLQKYFHPDTLKEVLVAFRILKERENFFLTSCLLGILHHVRPGFLSFPASHLTPYLRTKKYPPEEYPEMYAYRDLRSRFIAKVRRAYRRAYFTAERSKVWWKAFCENAMDLPVESSSVDAIISSPPYFGALDYARDNRLRLWFLGEADWRGLDKRLTASDRVYIPQMTKCIEEMDRVLKPGKHCVLVLGDVERNGKHRPTAQIISELAQELTGFRWAEELIYTDEIPDIRRSRRKTKTTKHERILVMRKTR